mmetsp:Transcript_18278/g.41327  ORF Transcript_18278/g.41327 Transcript_18278/m.41327 type:complete len:496 (-) Transcript_18278:267-1754(-)
MAAPGGGRLISKAWQWFNDQQANDEVEELRKNVGHLPAVPEPVKEVYQGLPDVSGSVICIGCTGYIGEAVVFDAVRRGLKVTVLVRPQSLDRTKGHFQELKIEDRVTLATGDVAVPADIERAMKDAKASCCISLLASPQITNEQNIHDVDYMASHNVVEAARKCGIKHFIYCSDTGVYQPTICCQFHKLRIEGELMRCLPDGMQWTIVRPTTYHPYVVSAIVLDEVRRGKNASLFGSGDKAGELALYNPIAREDLGRFIVSCVNNTGTYGRVMAVGGPWSADNVCSLRDTTNWMIQMATPPGQKPSKITGLGMDLSSIIYRWLEIIGTVSPQLKKVATVVFFYTKYWSTVSHFSPGTGVYGSHEYTQELVDAMKKDPEKFSEFIKDAMKSTTGSVVFPTPRNSWWDISQPSLSPEQMPMGAGKPGASPESYHPLRAAKRSDEEIRRADQAGLAKLREMAIGPICIGDDFYDCVDAGADEDLDAAWVKLEGEHHSD